jgi:hypothetical protein
MCQPHLKVDDNRIHSFHPALLGTVAAHKGRIWAENNSDTGANLSFEIPLSLETNEKEEVLIGANLSFEPPPPLDTYEQKEVLVGNTS